MVQVEFFLPKIMTKLNTDCLGLIFNELRRDKISLHSCLLVNKEWCNVVIPVLWKEHSWSNNKSNKSEKMLFNTILSCLSSSSKQFLSDNDIKLPSTILLTSPIFNYISFCKFPEAGTINKIISMVLSKHDKRKLLEQEIYKLFVSQCKNIKRLRWETSQPLSLFSGASTCFSQLYGLSIDVNFVNSNALHEMAQICNGLYGLAVDNCQDLPGLISLIDAQKNLKSVSIHRNKIMKGSCKELGKALARKGDTINILGLNSVSIIPPTFLTSLVNLKEISIYNDGIYDNSKEELKEFQHHLAIFEFPDLQCLEFDHLSYFKEISLLIEKTKGNVLDVRIYDFEKKGKNTGMLIKAIANNCPKIKCLITYLEQIDFINVKLLLLNCGHLERINFYGLNFLISDDDDNDNNNNNNIGDELLDILTKFSPNSLNNIAISGSWKYSIDAFKRFFESCRERTLSSFEIIHDNGCYYITEQHRITVRKYLKEGVIRNSNCR